MSRVELKSVAKRYGDVDVIRNLDLEVEDGSFTVLVGPSGCGKSTLLRMVAGLEDITSGELLIDGKLANRLEPVERGVAMVFQNYALYPHMSVARNIGFSLKMAGHGKADIAQRVEKAASILQIGHLLDRKPANLSGGQRQRVAIGRAIVRDPQVFLFDEPLSNLDAELRVSMRVELARLHQQLKATMIYVTHDQTEAMTLADKIVVMRDGNIEQQGSPKQLYMDPENTFVAGFIGSPRMNFLAASIHGADLRLEDGTTVAGIGAGLSGSVTLGVRPEHVRGPGVEEIGLQIQVDMVEYLGGTRFIYGRLNTGSTIVVEARERDDVQSGQTLDASIGRNDIMIFDGDGRRVRV